MSRVDRHARLSSHTVALTERSKTLRQLLPAPAIWRLDEADANLAEARSQLHAAQTNIDTLRHIEALVHSAQVTIDYLSDRSGNP
jgi:hypothetical protein